MSAENLLDRLEGVKEIRPDRFKALCPAHDDSNPSLDITVTDDKLLVKCWAGCGAADIVQAVGLEFHSLLLDKPCSKCGQEFHPFHPDHDLCSRCFKGEKPEQYHRRRTTRRRIPASEALEAIDHEATVVAIIGADFLNQKTIDNETWDRLALAVSRIGNARALR